MRGYFFPTFVFIFLGILGCQTSVDLVDHEELQGQNCVLYYNKEDAGFRQLASPEASFMAGSRIHVQDEPAHAIIHLIHLNWNVDANSFYEVEARLAWRLPDSSSQWISHSMPLRETGNDFFDGYSMTSSQTVYLKVPEYVSVNGLWTLWVQDKSMDENPFDNTGKLDTWSIKMCYGLPQIDLRGGMLQIPKVIPWATPFTLRGQVVNKGMFGTVKASFRQQFLLSKNTTWDDEDDIVIGSFTHESEVPPATSFRSGAEGRGDVFQVQLQMPLQPPQYSGAGSFYLGMRTDAGESFDNPGQIQELNEANNGPGAWMEGSDWARFNTLPCISINDKRIREGSAWSREKATFTVKLNDIFRGRGWKAATGQGLTRYPAFQLTISVSGREVPGAEKRPRLPLN
jgi:hypothetical protein